MAEFASIDHLSPEAVVAFVDDEMDGIACKRAMSHLMHCEACRKEVRSQRQMAARLQASAARVSADLLGKLQSIASNCPEGPGAEELRQIPQTFTDRLDSMARSLRATLHPKQ